MAGALKAWNFVTWDWSVLISSFRLQSSVRTRARTGTSFARRSTSGFISSDMLVWVYYGWLIGKGERKSGLKGGKGNIAG